MQIWDWRQGFPQLKLVIFYCLFGHQLLSAWHVLFPGFPIQSPECILYISSLSSRISPAGGLVCSSGFFHCPTCLSMLPMDFHIRWLLFFLPKVVFPDVRLLLCHGFNLLSTMVENLNFILYKTQQAFFFPQKSTLLLRSWAFAICPDVSLLAHLYKGKSTSVQFSDLGQVQLECLGVCAISLVWEEGVKEEFIIPIVGFLWSRVSGFLEKEKGTMPEVAIWQGLPHCAQVSFPPRRGIIPLL